MRYLLLAFALISFPAFGVINTPSGQTINSGDLVDCGDGTNRTNCAASKRTVNVTCTAPTQRADDSALAADEISHYIFRARNQAAKIVVVKIAPTCAFSADLKVGTWAVQIKTVLNGGLQGSYSASFDYVINP